MIYYNACGAALQVQKFFGLWNLDLTVAVDWDIIFYIMDRLVNRCRRHLAALVSL